MSALIEVRLAAMMLPSSANYYIRVGDSWGRPGERLAVEPGRASVSVLAKVAGRRLGFRLVCTFEVVIAPCSLTTVELPSRRVAKALNHLKIRSAVEALI